MNGYVLKKLKVLMKENRILENYNPTELFKKK